MKHDTKLHHWVTLLAQLEEKLNSLYLKLYNTNQTSFRSASKLDSIRHQIIDIEARIAEIKSQIDQY